jgi:hypothetical protein
MPWKPGECGNPEKKFSKTNQPKGAGRKRSIYKVLKETGYSRDDIRVAMTELCFYKDSELKRVYEDDKAPMILKIIARALNKSLVSGDLKAISQILETLVPKETNVTMTHEGEQVFLIGGQEFKF